MPQRYCQGDLFVKYFRIKASHGVLQYYITQNLARSGKGGEVCFILPLSHVWTWGRGYFKFGNGNQFPGDGFPFPIFDVAYMVSSADHLPVNQVFKYDWKGGDDDLDATISYVYEKGGGECDNASDENMDGDSDGDGRGKQISHSGM